MTTETVGVDGVTFVDTAHLNPALLDAVYRRVLVATYPPAKLPDQAAFRTAHAPESAHDHPGIVALHDGEPIGAVFGRRHRPTGIVRVSHLAVVPRYRGARIGERLLTQAVRTWSARPSTAAVLAEIEDPATHHGDGHDDGHGDPAARRRFYVRSGARKVPISAFQPSVGPGLPRLSDMLLVSLVPGQHALNTGALLAFLDDYVAEGEGPPAADDAQYRAMRTSAERCGPTIALVDL